jgi:hypothetical protein
MILSLNLRTEHGCPGWFVLTREEKTKLLTFRSKTNEQISAHLGNYGHDNELPQGFAIQKRALQKQPWLFSKQLYLGASGMTVQSIDGNEYHSPIELNQSLVCVALSSEGELFAYLVVEPSMDVRFKYSPVLVNKEKF